MQEICSPGHAANPHLIFGFLQRLSLFAHERRSPRMYVLPNRQYPQLLFQNRRKRGGKGAGNSVGMAHQYMYTATCACADAASMNIAVRPSAYALTSS